jgi:hypothetical protein
MSLRPAITVSTLLALAAIAPLAGASIVGVTGQATQIGSPASCLPSVLTGPNAYAWDEQQNLNISAGLLVDMSTNPSFAPGGNTPGVVTGNLDSHFIHFDTLSGNSATGTVTFSGFIVGVMFSDNFLDLSDAPCGALGTAYPTGFAGRGFNLQGTIRIIGPTLFFDLHGHPGAIDPEQVRVLTRHVPASGPLALLGLGGLVALRRRQR